MPSPTFATTPRICFFFLLLLQLANPVLSSLSTYSACTTAQTACQSDATSAYTACNANVVPYCQSSADNICHGNSACIAGTIAGCQSGSYAGCTAGQTAGNQACTNAYTTCVANQGSGKFCVPVYNDCVNGYNAVHACCISNGGTGATCSKAQGSSSLACTNGLSASSSCTTMACCDSAFQTSSGITKQDAISYELSCGGGGGGRKLRERERGEKTKLVLPRSPKMLIEEAMKGKRAEGKKRATLAGLKEVRRAPKGVRYLRGA